MCATRNLTTPQLGGARYDSDDLSIFITNLRGEETFEIPVKKTTIPARYRDCYDGVYAGESPSLLKPAELLVAILKIRMRSNNPSSGLAVRCERRGFLSPCAVGSSIVVQGQLKMGPGKTEGKHTRIGMQPVK